MASIWRVTFMEPSSALIPDPHRPATIKAVIMGPNSRTMDSPTMLAM
jgi:hypothetical protein